MNRHQFLRRLALAGCAGLTGCAGYELGPTQGRTAGAQSIEVIPFDNTTIEPRLSEPVTYSLRRQLQQDGTYRLDTGGEASIVVTGKIVEFTRSGLSFLREDTRTVRDYRVAMTAEVTARERTTGRLLLDRKVSGHSTIRVGNDLISAERQVIPLVAEDLARNITSLLADGSW